MNPVKPQLVLFFIIIVGLQSCHQAPFSETVPYSEEVEKLASNDEKRSFLETILELDQEVRSSSVEAKLIAEFGYNSDKHMGFIEKQWAQDEINLLKVEAFIEEYGYPRIAELGKDAAITPWLVIHHSTDMEKRLAHFSVLYGAYLTQDIKDIALSMYLERTYKFIHRESITMEDPYTTDEKIDRLIEKLDLVEEKETVKNRTEQITVGI